MNGIRFVMIVCSLVAMVAGDLDAACSIRNGRLVCDRQASRQAVQVAYVPSAAPATVVYKPQQWAPVAAVPTYYGSPVVTSVQDCGCNCGNCNCSMVQDVGASQAVFVTAQETRAARRHSMGGGLVRRLGRRLFQCGG